MSTAILTILITFSLIVIVTLLTCFVVYATNKAVDDKPIGYILLCLFLVSLFTVAGYTIAQDFNKRGKANNDTSITYPHQ